MPIPYRSRPRPEPRLYTCSALLRKHEDRSVLRTLCIDIGGTGIKMIVLDPSGEPINERARELTPKPATPHAVLGVIRGMVKSQPKFERVSVGFPGVVRQGITMTAPNLSSEWENHDL